MRAVAEHTAEPSTADAGDQHAGPQYGSGVGHAEAMRPCQQRSGPDAEAEVGQRHRGTRQHHKHDAVAQGPQLLRAVAHVLSNGHGAALRFRKSKDGRHQQKPAHPHQHHHLAPGREITHPRQAGVLACSRSLQHVAPRGKGQCTAQRGAKERHRNGPAASLRAEVVAQHGNTGRP